jgi:trehalose-phosphatase
MNRPRHLLHVWAQIRRRMRRANQLVLLTDFDGTLTPIRNLPDQANLSAAVRDLLTSICEKGVTVGVISGRSLADLRTRVGLQGTWYVGTHGFSLCSPSGRLMFLASAKQKEAVKRARRKLVRRLSGLDGVHLESKPASVAVHYRNASRRSRVQALDRVREVLQETRGLRLFPGKSVWELLPDSPASKWTAIQHILGRWGRGQRHGRLVFYVGDDASDEKVFEKLQGITAAVGKRRQTRARFFLRSPAEVRQFLRNFLEAVR